MPYFTNEFEIFSGFEEIQVREGIVMTERGKIRDELFPLKQRNARMSDTFFPPNFHHPSNWTKK